MKVNINPDLCIGCGACEATCPEVFKLDGDTARVLVDTVPESLNDEVIEAAEGCPGQAIEVEN